jgi:hypothetical protein
MYIRNSILGENRIKYEGDHSHSFSTEVKKGGPAPTLPHMLYGMLDKDQRQLRLYISRSTGKGVMIFDRYYVASASESKVIID